MMRRYQYDPNGRVRDAMSHIWTALVPEPRAALDAHFGAIADELLREMGGRMWRNREAACLGLADLLQVPRLTSQAAVSSTTSGFPGGDCILIETDQARVPQEGSCQTVCTCLCCQVPLMH